MPSVPRVPVGYAHLEQLDKSLNADILDIWPTGSMLEIKAGRDAAPGRERRHLADRLLVLHRVGTALAVLRSWAHAPPRTEMIEPCRNMVERLGRYQRRADVL